MRDRDGGDLAVRGADADAAELLEQGGGSLGERDEFEPGEEPEEAGQPAVCVHLPARLPLLGERGEPPPHRFFRGDDGNGDRRVG